jgi:hypothetical protein
MILQVHASISVRACAGFVHRACACLCALACVCVCVCVRARARACMRSVSLVSLQEQARVCLHVTPCMCRAGSEETRVTTLCVFGTAKHETGVTEAAYKNSGCCEPAVMAAIPAAAFQAGTAGRTLPCSRFNCRLCSFSGKLCFYMNHVSRKRPGNSGHFSREARREAWRLLRI